MAEYEARMSSTPASAKGSKVREKQERAKKEATVEGASRGIKRTADKSQETKEAQEERSGDEAKEPVVLTKALEPQPQVAGSPVTTTLMSVQGIEAGVIGHLLLNKRSRPCERSGQR